MPRPVRQVQRGGGGKPRAYALSLLLVGLQFLALAHLTLERHGVCWEHGTLTELDASPTSTSVVAASEAQPGFHAASSATALEDVEGHHHCPVQASRRNWGSPPAGLPLLLPATQPRAVAAGTAFAQRADAALLLRAPKQSPPLSA